MTYFPSFKSMCECGHPGDGEGSSHAGINGHGRCMVEGCDCIQFTWVRFTDDFLIWLKDQAKLVVKENSENEFKPAD